MIAWGVRSHPRAERVRQAIVAQTATIGYISNSVILRQVLDSYIPHETLPTYFSNRANGKRFF